ncbi:MAG TPA: sulfite exporter TauE/SafE family protein [Rhodocyclaceae bacterium]
MHLLPINELALTLALGAGLGFFGGLFGIGGGIIAIPLLVLGFGMEQPLAQGTALVLMVPNLLLGWWRYSQRHPIVWRQALTIGLSATLTTWLIAHLATRLDPQWLRALFSGFLLLLALRLLHPGRRKATADDRALKLRVLPLVGAVGGGSMGLLGIGGGLVATPLLSGWLGQRQTVAQSLALALVAPSSVVALATYAGAHRVDWALGLPLALGGLFTVSAGVALAHRLPEARMRTAFGWMLLATAGWLLLAPLLMPKL